MRFVVAILLAATLFAATAALAQQDYEQDYIQALVGDAVVTRQQVLELSAKGEESLRQRIYESRTRPRPEVVRSNISVLREQAFNDILDFELVLQEFKNLEKKGVKIPESVIDGIVQKRIREEPYSGDRVRFIKDLQTMGKTLEQFRTEQRNRLIFDAMVDQYVPKPIISPKQIETYYQEHQDDFKVPERVKIRMIFLKKSADDTNGLARQKAEDIVTSLKEGSSFKDLEKTYSENTATDGAEPDWIEISGKSQAIQDAVAKIKPGEFSGVAETPEGYFIVLLEARDPVHVRALSDPQNSPRGEIERTLMGQETNRRRKAWLSRLQKRILVQRP